MSNIFSRLFSRKNTDKEAVSTKSPHPYSFQDEVSEGFKLCVTMHGNVPLCVLKRHGERVGKIPDSDINLSPSHAVWVPIPGSEFDFLGEGASMASAIGYVPQDGGALLDYLCKAREIIEQKLDPTKDLYDSCNRINELKLLSKGPVYKLDDNAKIMASGELIDYFPRVFGSEDRALRLILKEHGLHELNVLSYQHIIELVGRGYMSVQSVIEVGDDVLLSLKGIGQKKIDKFHESARS